MGSRRGGPFGTFSETCHCERWPHSHICSRCGAKVPTERGRRRSSTDGGGSLTSRQHFAHFATARQLSPVMTIWLEESIRQETASNSSTRGAIISCSLTVRLQYG